MKFYILTLLLILQLISFSVQKTTAEDRKVKIKDISLKFVESANNRQRSQKVINLLPESQDFTGKIQFYPLSKYWKIDFLNNGLDLSQQFEFYQSLIEQNIQDFIGTSTFSEENQSLKQITLIKPESKMPNFEHSKLKNKCWKIDIFPDQDTDNHLIFSFCVSNEKEDDIVSRYRHILEDKELGKKNHE